MRAIRGHGLGGPAAPTLKTRPRKDAVANPRRLSENRLTYCGKAGLGHFLRSFSLNRATIRLKRAQKLPQAGLSLATVAILGQPPSNLLSREIEA